MQQQESNEMIKDAHLYDVRSRVTTLDTEKEYSNSWREKSAICHDDAEKTTTASSTTQKQTKPELTTKAWFRHGTLPEVRISFEEKDYVDDVKKRILRDGSFWFCSMRGRSDLRIFTEEGVEIGAMEKFHPYSRKDCVFVIKLIRQAHAIVY